MEFSPGLLPGAVLYGGEQRFQVEGIQVINPLKVDDPWETLLSLISPS